MKTTLWMRTQQKALIAALVLCTGSFAMAAYAQDAPPPPPPDQQQQGPPPGGYGRGGGRGAREVDMMTKELNLSGDQVTKLKQIDTDSRDKIMALRQDTTSDPADKRKQMGAIQKAREDSIKAILNDDQKVKYAAMRERMQERREERGGNGGPPSSATPPPPPPQQ